MPKVKLSQQVVSEVVDAISAWPGTRITWKDVAGIFEDLTKSTITRPALMQCDAIRAAYDRHNAGQPESREKRGRLVQQLERLRRKIAYQQLLLNRYAGQLVQVIHNAMLHDLSLEELMEPLPPVFRRGGSIDKPDRKRPSQASR